MIARFCEDMGKSARVHTLRLLLIIPYNSPPARSSFPLRVLVLLVRVVVVAVDYSIGYSHICLINVADPARRNPVPLKDVEDTILKLPALFSENWIDGRRSTCPHLQPKEKLGDPIAGTGPHSVVTGALTKTTCVQVIGTESHGFQTTQELRKRSRHFPKDPT